MGIEEPGTDEPPLSLQPNPAHDLLTVAWPLLSGATITITDLSGRPVLQSTTARFDREVLDISTLPAGAYVLQLMGTEGRRTSRLFVKE
ncbi:MAG: T9SS type A sorting domain-containing protein [Flavobacteriales bacterium]|nr:T9SS type A sorting domain-containing protein [Flavobacteriales bacterium]